VAQTRRGPFTWSLVPIGLLVVGRWGLFYWALRLLSLSEEALWGASTLLRLALFGLVFALERGYWGEFFVTRRHLGLALRDGLVMAAVFAGIGWAYAQLTLGGIYWLPLSDWLPTFLAALIPSGLVEEVEFRALLLGLLRRWGVGAQWANLLVAAYFGPVYHNRYIFGGNYLVLLIVTLFGFVAGWLTLRRGNVASAVIGHTAMNFLIFLFIGGKVTKL